MIVCHVSIVSTCRSLARVVFVSQTCVTNQSRRVSAQIGGTTVKKLSAEKFLLSAVYSSGHQASPRHWTITGSSLAFGLTESILNPKIRFLTSRWIVCWKKDRKADAKVVLWGGAGITGECSRRDKLVRVSFICPEKSVLKMSEF